VLGREFAYELLASIAPQDESALQEGLAPLVQAELLYQRGRPPRARYLFKHALTQNAAYASLLKRTRQQVHQHIAEVLEARFPALVETQPKSIACGAPCSCGRQGRPRRKRKPGYSAP
jgi:predicted ATPase